MVIRRLDVLTDKLEENTAATLKLAQAIVKRSSFGPASEPETESPETPEKESEPEKKD